MKFAKYGLNETECIKIDGLCFQDISFSLSITSQ